MDIYHTRYLLTSSSRTGTLEHIGLPVLPMIISDKDFSKKEGFLIRELEKMVKWSVEVTVQ